MYLFYIITLPIQIIHISQSAGAVEYFDFTSAEGQDTKQSDGEVHALLDVSGMRNTPSLLSLPGPLWLGGVSLDRVLSMGQIELKCVLMLNWIVWELF